MGCVRRVSSRRWLFEHLDTTTEVRCIGRIELDTHDGAAASTGCKDDTIALRACADLEAVTQDAAPDFVGQLVPASQITDQRCLGGARTGRAGTVRGQRSLD